MKLKLGLLIIMSGWLFGAVSIVAQEDEAQLFQDAQVITQAKPSTPNLVFSTLKSTTFSGRLESYSLGFLNDSFSGYSAADLFLDVRLPKGIKAFADVTILNATGQGVSGNASTSVGLKELFLDLNLSDQLYIRTGKQFIQWGRGYFWNPTDFINRDKRNFLNLDALRSGIEGVKVQVPLPHQHHAVLFVDISHASKVSQGAALLHYDWVGDSSEAGLSVWLSRNAPVKYGFDLSTQCFGMDATLEAAFQNGYAQQRLELSTSTLLNPTAEWVPSITAGVSKQLNWEKPDRIIWHYEWFYNGLGYATPLSDTQRDILRTQSLYIPNWMSRLYHATFLSIKDFPWYAHSLSINAIQSLTDSSGILSLGTGFQYSENLQLNGSINGVFGPDNSEYGYRLDRSFVIFQAILQF